MGYLRTLQLPALLKKNSFFLFGPRGTGKTSLIRSQLEGKSLTIDLLNSRTYRTLLEDPSALEGMIKALEKKPLYIVIDEVQKIPALLDEVHRLIEKAGYRFLLSGSSARKLKKSGVNLLAGRAWNANLFPLTWKELASDFNLEKYIRWGALPRVCLTSEPEEELEAYVNTYLKEEILQESIVRNISKFSGFLKFAAISNGALLNYERTSQSIGISATTIREYYSILKDTLLAFELTPYQETKKRKPIATSKYFFFDTGVCNHLAGIEQIDRLSDIYGNRFEHFITMELKAFLSYNRIKKDLSFWRSINHDEVDFVIGSEVAIEVKATKKISPEDLKGLKRLKEEGIFKKYYLVSQDPTAIQKEGIYCLHYKDFLKRLWQKEILA